MANKPFQPKLGSARPRVSAALQAAAVTPFTPDLLTPPTKKPPAPKPPKGKLAAALLALKGQF